MRTLLMLVLLSIFGSAFAQTRGNCWGEGEKFFPLQTETAIVNKNGRLVTALALYGVAVRIEE